MKFKITVSEEPNPGSTKLHRESGAIPVHILPSSSDLFIGITSNNATKSDLVLLGEAVLGDIVVILPPALGCT